MGNKHDESTRCLQSFLLRSPASITFRGRGVASSTRVRATSAAASIVPLLTSDTSNQACCMTARARVVTARVFVCIGTCKQRVLHLPHRGFTSDREFKVLLRDRIPVLIHHHDAKEHAKREEEDSVDVVFHSIADCCREGKEHDLSNDEEGGTKNNIANRPAVLERPEYQNKLGDDIYDRANERPQNVDDPKTNRF